jgi:probable addiction module antidote protein
MPKNPHPPAVPYHDYLIAGLKDRREAAEYLNAAMQDEDPRVFLIALRNVAEARGLGITKLARRAKLNRESLYRMLSKKGNPELQSLTHILDALGMKLSVKAKAS